MSGASPRRRPARSSSSITCTSSTRTRTSRPECSIFPTSWCCARSPRPGALPAAASATPWGVPYVVAVLRAAGGSLHRGGALGRAGALPAPARGRAAGRSRGPGPRGAPPPERAACRRRPVARRSQANFLLVECGPRAASIHAGLAARGVQVRDFPAAAAWKRAAASRCLVMRPTSKRLSDALDGTLALRNSSHERAHRQRPAAFTRETSITVTLTLEGTGRPT